MHHTKKHYHREFFVTDQETILQVWKLRDFTITKNALPYKKAALCIGYLDFVTKDPDKKVLSKFLMIDHALPELIMHQDWTPKLIKILAEQHDVYIQKLGSYMLTAPIKPSIDAYTFGKNGAPTFTTKYHEKEKFELYNEDLLIVFQKLCEFGLLDFQYAN
jgi:hypothetical protein